MSHVPRPLTNHEAEFFFREGYLVVENLLDDAALQPVIDEITAAIDTRARALMAEGKLSQAYSNWEFDKRLAKIHAETEVVTRGILSGQLNGPAFFHLITHPRILDIVESVCGPEVIASGVYRLRPKIPGWNFGEVPWHQDSAYFEPFCDRSLIVTLWIPLVDATAEKGCMWVVPRMHQGSVAKHVPATNYLKMAETGVLEERKVCAPVRKGGVLMLTNRTPHASFENRTDGIRWSMDLRYQSAALPTNARISKIDGELAGGGSGGVPVACYPPEPEFLVRSRSRTQEILRNSEEFHRLRLEHQGAEVTKRWR